MHIRDNVFIVSGGASGLRAAVVRMLVEEGGRVIIADLQQEAAQALAEDCGSAARSIAAAIPERRLGSASLSSSGTPRREERPRRPAATTALAQTPQARVR